jgi:DNA/RNA endonuclease YhcR with UshA esterase domain
MKRPSLLALGSLGLGLALAPLASAAESAEYSGSDAAKHVGETVTVTDKVEDVYQAKGGNIFLNLGAKHPNETFTIFVPASSAGDFKDVKSYDGKMVSVTGKVTEHNGKPEIAVKSPSDITVKDGAAATSSEASPAAAAKP